MWFVRYIFTRYKYIFITGNSIDTYKSWSLNLIKVNFEIFAVGTATIFYLFPVPFLFFMFYLDIFMMGPVLPGPTEADTTCSMPPINIIQREKRNSGKYRYYIKKFSEPITINLQRITIETNCYENWRIFLYFLTCQLLIYSTIYL